MSSIGCDDSRIAASESSPEDSDLLHNQIGIAIGYGYVVGAVTVENDTVRYTQLSLTSRGRDFLATMESSPSVTEKAEVPLRKTLLASAALISGVLLVSLLAFVLAPRL